jgi:uncharacterized membrane protein
MRMLCVIGQVPEDMSSDKRYASPSKPPETFWSLSPHGIQSLWFSTFSSYFLLLAAAKLFCISGTQFWNYTTFWYEKEALCLLVLFPMSCSIVIQKIQPDFQNKTAFHNMVVAGNKG